MVKLELPPSDPSGYFIPTLNQMGYMTVHVDPYSQAFIEYAASHKGLNLEIGTAYGVATLQALARGATVVANDIEIRHLHILTQRTAEKDLPRLRLVPGAFPRELHFEENTFQSILIARVLHFFDPVTLELAVKKAWDWLKPTGKLIVVADTPYLKNLEAFIPIYEERVSKGDPWPGVIENPKHYAQDAHFPDFLHLLSEAVLRRVLSRQGFTIEKLEHFRRIDYPLDRQLDGRESVGAIVVKCP